MSMNIGRYRLSGKGRKRSDRFEKKDTSYIYIKDYKSSRGTQIINEQTK